MNSTITIRRLIELCCISLIALIFFCKVSLKWMKIIPYSMPPVLFQYGLHPYINFGLQFMISLVLIFIWVKNKNKFPLSPFYKAYIYSMLVLLSVQTMFQITMVNIGKSVLVQIAGLGMAILLVLIYGIIIPQLFPLKKFIFYTMKISVMLVIGSMLNLPLFFGEMFRGGRFVGLFKHIPHMVSASTVAFIFFFPTIFSENKWSLRNNTPLKLLALLLLLLAVIITSTKAALGTVAITAFIGTFLFGSKRRLVRIFKFAALSAFLISTLLIGVPTGELVYKVSTGKEGLGLRKAQDGVSSRMEEVTRGWSMFEKSPLFGLGLLYKFLNNKEEGIEVESYNSFKDPHNLFVSAAVIGGYPLFIYAILGYLLMIAGAIKGINQSDPNRQIIGLFLLSHLPVFVIYHAHFSLGGMADRIYWLVFGYLGQNWGRGADEVVLLEKQKKN